MSESTISVARKLNEVRVKKALTVAKFGEFMGVHPSTMRSFLQTDNPSVSSVYELSERLGCSVAYLISGDDPPVAYDFMYYKGPGGKQLRPNISARVEIILREKGLRKIDTCRAMGVSPSWWPPILKRNNPSMKTLAKIAVALGVSPLELIKPVSTGKFGTAMMPELPKLEGVVG